MIETTLERQKVKNGLFICFDDSLPQFELVTKTVTSQDGKCKGTCTFWGEKDSKIVFKNGQFVN